MNPLRGGRWKCPSYKIVIKQIDRDLLYNNFVCNEISGSSQQISS